MTVEVKVPRLAESISEAVLAEWLKADGSEVRADEPIATLETDKAAVEIAATDSGVLRQARQAGATVQVGEVLARIEPASGAAKPNGAGERGRAAGRRESEPAAANTPAPATTPSPQPRPAPAGSPPRPPVPVGTTAPAPAARSSASPAVEDVALSPSVRRLVEEHGLSPAEIEPSGRGGRLLKEDVLRHLERREVDTGSTTPAPPAPSARAPRPEPATPRAATESTAEAEPDERVVPMSRIRQRIAERLVQAQHAAAILTTFNEIDMSAVMELRARHRDSFEKRHGVKLGFMSFFVRASVLALGEIPELNAEIRGTDIVYRSRVHMGIAVGTERGLVVPVVRDAHRLGFAEIEREIARLSARARGGSLNLEELMGGTFTISNGGVYGSLLSTPILNPPQSGILGMHKIEKRPIAVDDQVVVRPMMYVALSYDHRIVDGEQAVGFLVRVKERLEDPERMLLDV